MLKIGHRGACGYEPENTLRSFKKAIDLGADMVECDVWLTKDKKIVVIHDDTVDRTTNGKGRVNQLTLAEIKKLDAGKSEKIPTLFELLTLVKSRCQINIEVKTKAVAQYLIKELKEANFFIDDILISSSYLEPLKSIRSDLPEVKIAWIFKSMGAELKQLIWGALMLIFLPLVHQSIIRILINNKIETVNIYHPLATQNFIKRIHRANKSIFVWTVNTSELINKFKSQNIDGIFSNFPDRL